MSFVLDVPVQLLLAFATAVPTIGVEEPQIEAAYEVSVVRRYNDFGEGAYKFRPQTWLAALKSDHANLQVRRLAKRIFRTSNNYYYVPAREDRRRVLSLRTDRELAKMVATSFAAHNANAMSLALGRNVVLTDLYLAHMMGASAAVQLIEVMRAKPNDPAYFHLARIAPNFAAESLVPRRQTTLKQLSYLLKKSLFAGYQKARAQINSATPDLRSTDMLNWDPIATVDIRHQKDVGRFASRNLEGFRFD